METQIIIITLAIVVAFVAVGIWLYLRKRQTSQLRNHFGAEYDHAVIDTGSQARAEAELKARSKRMKQLNIVRLPPEEVTRFSEAWNSIQSRFVDNPTTAVGEADRLVIELMQKRGYPMSDFEQRAADLSVDHPVVVESYRAARDIAIRNQRGEANTEDLRKAFVHYRSLFEELLEVQMAAPLEVHR